MNAKTKRRLIAVTGVIVIVLVLLLAFVAGSAAAKVMSLSEVAQVVNPAEASANANDLRDRKIQVSGNVVENSFSIDDNVLSFQIYDPEADPSDQFRLPVRYDGGVSATFGNDVTAICTGKLDETGTLVCSELVTKCPSKYENATGALTIAELLGYGASVLDKPVKVAGIVKEGTLAGVDKAERFVIVDADSADELRIVYEGALSDETKEGASVVLTGSIGSDGRFTATNVALEG